MWHQTDFGQLDFHYKENANRKLFGCAVVPVPPRKPAREPSSDFTHLRRAGHFTDAALKVGHVTFPVHRNILSCCSPYFRALFTDLARARVIGPSIHATSEAHYATSSTNQCSTLRPSLTKSSKAPGMTVSPSPTETAIDNKAPTSFPSEVTPLLCAAPGQYTDLNARHSHSKPVPSSPLEHSCSGEAKGRHNFSGNRNSSIDNSHVETTVDWNHSDKGWARQEKAPTVGDGLVYEVTLCDVSPDTMNTIVEYAYGGKVAVEAHNVEKLLPAADRFQVGGLITECCDFLISQLAINNCISIVKFASHFYTCRTVQRDGTQFLLKHFVQVFQTSPEFEKLSAEELSAILRSDELNVKHEELVLDAIIRWVAASPDNREGLINGLVLCARVGLLVPECMQVFVDSWLQSSQADATFTYVTLQVMEAVLQLQKEQMVQVDSAMFAPRIPHDLIFVIGGSNFGFPLNMIEVLDCRAGTWTVICPYDFAPRSYHGMVVLDNEIYVIGGFSGQVYLSSCCKLRPETLKWEDVTPMNTKRCYVGAAMMRGYIYAVGGFDGLYRLKSAEKFDKQRNQWSFIAPMLQQRSDAGVTVLDDKLYVCGGFNGLECIRAMEVYDADLDLWSSLPSMPRGRSGLGLTTHDGCLYAIGGFDGMDSAVRLSTAESYCPETRQWTQLEAMPHPRSNLAVEVLENVLYAIGGFTGDRTTSVVECYDFASDSWFQSNRLSHNRSALGVCVISDLYNTSELLRREKPVARSQPPTRSF